MPHGFRINGSTPPTSSSSTSCSATRARASRRSGARSASPRPRSASGSRAWRRRASSAATTPRSTRALGLTLSIVLRIRPAPREIHKVAELAQRPEVTECVRVTGEDCFVMRAHVRDVLHLEELIDRFVIYGQTTTSIVQSRRSRRGLSLGRVLPDPFHWQGDHVAAALPGGRVLFSTRRGGVSERPVRVAQPRPAHRGRRRERRRQPRPARGGGRPAARPLPLRPPGPRRARAPGRRPDGRARGGGRPGDGAADLAALVFVADCLPVMLSAPGRRRRAARRLARPRGGDRGRGRRGAARARRRGELTAALGPSARGCCYEVGRRSTPRSRGSRRAGGERNLDLPAVARHALGAAGVGTVHDTGLCTMCGEDGLFFSHRRDGGVTGRQAGVVWRA